MTRREFPESLAQNAVIAEAKRLIDEMVAAAKHGRR
jgi:hypothetical protein